MVIQKRSKIILEQEDLFMACSKPNKDTFLESWITYLYLVTLIVLYSIT